MRGYVVLQNTLFDLFEVAVVIRRIASLSSSQDGDLNFQIVEFFSELFHPLFEIDQPFNLVGRDSVKFAQALK